MLRSGRSGLGFAVGLEPLASVFASRGVTVLGTDLATDESGWGTTGEHAAAREALWKPELVDRDTFDRNVDFQPADMNNIEDLRSEAYDFVWSSCSFEHLGSLKAGLRFVTDAMRLVKPGGVAVHTTEYNVSSNQETLTSGPNVIYRRRDIEDLDYALRKVSSALEQVDFYAGHHQHDIDYDFPPYFSTDRKHAKLLLGGFISTSLLLIIRKGNVPKTE